MSTFIEPLELTMGDREMSSNTSIAFTMFLGACFAGFYAYDMYKKYKETESSVKELEQEIGEVESIQQTHSDILQEHEQRLREKKNFDESEEVQEGKYQAWIGTYEKYSLLQELLIEMEITILRKKISTIKKNQEWVSWDKSEDGSVTVRDFYMGNYNPQFEWEFVERDCYGNDHYLEISMCDTFINGWDSTISIDITAKVSRPTISSDDEESEDDDTNDKKSEKNKSEIDVLLDFIEESSYDGDDNKLMNKVLKKCIQEKRIQWKRVLIDA